MVAADTFPFTMEPSIGDGGLYWCSTRA